MIILDVIDPSFVFFQMDVEDPDLSRSWAMMYEPLRLPTFISCLST